MTSTAQKTSCATEYSVEIDAKILVVSSQHQNVPLTLTGTQKAFSNIKSHGTGLDNIHNEM